MTATDNDGVLLEDVEDKVDFLVDAIKGMQENVKHIPKIREDISELKQDVKVIKGVVRETNKDLQSLGKRATVLEKTIG